MFSFMLTKEQINLKFKFESAFSLLLFDTMVDGVESTKLSKIFSGPPGIYNLIGRDSHVHK